MFRNFARYAGRLSDRELFCRTGDISQRVSAVDGLKFLRNHSTLSNLQSFHLYVTVMMKRNNNIEREDLMGLLKRLFGGGKEYGGIIEDLNLVDFWEELTEDERDKIRATREKGIGGSNRDIDDPNSTVTTSQSASGFLNNKAGWAISDKDYKLAEKLSLESIDRSKDPVDLHFAYNNLIKLYYKLRSEDDYLEKCIDYCQKDIKLYEGELRDEQFFKDNEPRVHAFKRLAIIYKKQERYEDAIEVCKQAIKYDMSDGTKSGFKGRLERLEGKLE